MRTIPNISRQLKKLDKVITTKFIPAITGGVMINEKEILLLSLPTKEGGLATLIFEKQCQVEYENSRLQTSL